MASVHVEIRGKAKQRQSRVNNVNAMVDYSPFKLSYKFFGYYLWGNLFSFCIVFLFENPADNLSGYESWLAGAAYATQSFVFSIPAATIFFALAVLYSTWMVNFMPSCVVMIYDDVAQVMLIRRVFNSKISRERINIADVASLSYSNAISSRFGHIYLKTASEQIPITAFPFSLFSRHNLVNKVEQILEAKNASKHSSAYDL